MHGERKIVMEDRSIIASLRSDPLFSAVFFSDLPKIFNLLEKKLSLNPPEELTKLLQPFTDIVSKQANKFVQELWKVLQQPQQSTNDIVELLLLICLQVYSPKLFHTIFVRLTGLSLNVIKEFYISALQDNGHYKDYKDYKILDTLQSYSPPAGLIQLAYSAGRPERIIQQLWNKLDDSGKRYVLRTAPELKNSFSFIKSYHKKNNIIYQYTEEKDRTEFHAIQPLSTMPYVLLELRTFIDDKKFAALIKKISQQSGIYFLCQIINYIDSLEGRELAVMIDSTIPNTISFLNLLHLSNDCFMAHTLGRVLFGDKKEELNYDFSSFWEKYFTLTYYPQHYDLATQLLAYNSNEKLTLDEENRKILRFWLSFHSQFKEPKPEIKLSTLLEEKFLPSEIKEINSRLRLIGVFQNSALSSLNRGRVELPVPIDLPSVIWQIIGSYLVSEDWYDEFIVNVPAAGPANFTQAEIGKLCANLATIEQLQMESKDIQHPPSSVIQRIFSRQSLFKIIMSLFCLGIIGFSIGIRRNKLNISQQRHNLLNSADGQSCSSSYYIVDYSEGLSPSLSNAFCQKKGYSNPCDSLCDLFNQIPDLALGNGLLAGLILSIAFFVIGFCCYPCALFNPRMEGLRKKANDFYNKKLNKSYKRCDIDNPDIIYSKLEEEKLEINASLVSLGFISGKSQTQRDAYDYVLLEDEKSEPKVRSKFF